VGFGISRLVLEKCGISRPVYQQSQLTGYPEAEEEIWANKFYVLTILHSLGVAEDYRLEEFCSAAIFNNVVLEWCRILF
jgi:hypothetical protein